MEYIVNGTDTLERIAARNDCTPSELMKFNHLHSRMIFPGQKMRIPPQLEAQPEVHKPAEKTTILPPEIGKEDAPLQKRTPDAAFWPQKLQALLPHKQPQTDLALTNGMPTEADNIPAAPGTAVRTSPTEAELDMDCFKKFLKLRVKHFTDEEGNLCF